MYFPIECMLEEAYVYMLSVIMKGCARGQAENLIKLHKSQLRSDRTSCRSALANQVRLVLHTAAYWLMLDVRDAIPKVRDLASAEFTMLRLRLLKLAARIVDYVKATTVIRAAQSYKDEARVEQRVSSFRRRYQP